MSDYSIAIVGPKDSILGFKAIGLHAVNATTSEEALEALIALQKDMILDENGIEKPKYAIILITEDLARAIPDEDYKNLSQGMLPAILIIPGVKGSTGYGLKRLGKIVERAIGSNILKDN